MRVYETVATAALVAGLIAGPAQGAVEIEPNETLGTATSVPAPEVAGGFRTTTQDIDAFRFAGLLSNTDYIATIDNTFLGVGWFDNNGTLLDSLANEGIFALDVVADGNGEVVLVVCGHISGTYDCTGQSSGFGPYTLSLPEPGPAPLAVTALIVLLGLHYRMRRPE